MDKVIVTALLIVGAVTAAVVVISSIGPSLSSSSQSIMESQRETSGKIRTSIEIIATSTLTGSQVDAWVKNVGLDPINAVSKSDVFVITPGTRFDSMTYSATGGDNSWVENPVGAPWDRGDTLHMVITLPASNPLAVGDHVLRVSTPNGVISDKTFSR